MHKEIYTYGSLRVGHYNYERFKEHYGDNFKYKDTKVIEGVALYHDKGLPYPYAVFTGDSNDKLEVDVMSCSVDCKATIDNMEFGAGYKETILEGKTIYTLNNPPKNTSKILGNWTKYVKDNNLNY